MFSKQILTDMLQMEVFIVDHESLTLFHYQISHLYHSNFKTTKNDKT